MCVGGVAVNVVCVYVCVCMSEDNSDLASTDVGKDLLSIRFNAPPKVWEWLLSMYHMF